MSYTVSLQQRIQQLKKIRADIPRILDEVARDATIRAVEATEDATPPKAGRGQSGTNTLTGELKAHWPTDSETEPKRQGNEHVTALANNVEYASYVNDGHRMDKHFVPGLYVNPGTGALEYDPSADVGIVVGTKTPYVNGEFMVDKGIEAYRRTVLAELDRKIQEAVG